MGREETSVTKTESPRQWKTLEEVAEPIKLSRSKPRLEATAERVGERPICKTVA